MSMLGATILTAIATAVLALGAIVTGIFAWLAFRKQSEEVRAIQRQTKDAADLLEVQSDQLDVQHDQFASLKQVNEKQLVVLELQAEELRKSLDERKREAEERRSGQASQVAAWFARGPIMAVDDEPWGAKVRNASGLPVYDVSVSFHTLEEPVPGGGLVPVAAGSATRTLKILPPGEEQHITIPPTSERSGPNATTASTRSASGSPTPRGTSGSAARAGR